MTAQQPLQVAWQTGMTSLDPAAWQRLNPEGYPFLRHEFLTALETSGSVSPEKGWQPYHWTCWRGDKLVAFLPCYIKYHSRGEYVFDFQWAEAYRHFPDPVTGQPGRDYYPKLLTAVPFTPVEGPRLLVDAGEDREEILQLLLKSIQEEVTEPQLVKSLSGWHLLFPEAEQADALQSLDSGRLLKRSSCQFHWFNAGYESFDAFLAVLKSKRRKEIRRERRKVADQGLELKAVSGQAITRVMLQQFYQFYRMTYYLHGQLPYLSEDFFLQLLESMPESLMLVLAEKEGEALAGALFFQDDKNLYGRYWGSLVEADALHFEACYYQGIEYAIKQGLEHFDPGTQGEHKLTRGFEPCLMTSLHWLPDANFSRAVADFLRREDEAIREYREEAASLLPYSINHQPAVDAVPSAWKK
ncbi:GNAT family N-acetyltransferase [Marinospirillum perlucidum]|uniref:GNAT family N-acetyltransferase n=1 Tax=Marinospirillum perlucidum TaxID=1982602 RepID=UPI001C49C3F8|nr:GNAT family N-acetyltransferase [Marinospirillum perlucidum]